jgi:antitoxin component YwqK of YwqJK toxin-antitoxin module
MFVVTSSYGQEVDTISEVYYMYGPTVFECKTGVCNGYKVSYYSNGQIHIIGRFENGKPVDSVITYFEKSGQLQNRRYYTKGKLNRSLTYYPSGQLQRDLNWQKKKERRFYPDNKIESVTSFCKKYFQKTYYPSGQLKVDENRKTKKTFSSSRTITTSWTRKEVLKLERIFKREMPFFEYTYKEYDDSSRLMKEATFYDHSLNWAGFYYPESFEKIDISKLDSVVYFNKQGQQIRKEIYKWEPSASVRQNKITYIKEGELWRRE